MRGCLWPRGTLLRGYAHGSRPLGCTRWKLFRSTPSHGGRLRNAPRKLLECSSFDPRPRTGGDHNAASWNACPSWIHIEPCAALLSQLFGRFWRMCGSCALPHSNNGWREAGRRSGGTCPLRPGRFQRSTRSAMESASSTSMPRYLTVLSIFVWPSNSCTARRLPVRR